MPADVSARQATSYDILLDVALLHLELLGNQSILEWQRLSESQFHEVYRLTNDYAEEGEGRESDAHRALSQWKRRLAMVRKAEEDVAVAAARLSNRLNLDPATRLEPIGGPLVPLNLIPLETSQQELIQIALRQRPDIEARSAAIAEAEYRRKQEIGRPLLPTAWIGFSSGVFGGGSNLNPPLVGNFASRSDSTSAFSGPCSTSAPATSPSSRNAMPRSARPSPSDRRQSTVPAMK